MITRIRIKNFKSLADFDLPLGMFTCLIGLNGAGKTTVLQVLDFIGHLACGITDFRNWKKSDFITNGSNLRTITLQVDFLIDQKYIIWFAKYNIDKQKFTEEQILHTATDHAEIYHYYLQLKENKLTYDGMPQPGTKDISDYNYKGSVLSAFKFEDPTICAVKDELQALKSLELLSPNILRQTSQPNDNLGIGGEGLAGFLSKLTEDDARSLAATLRDFYPQVDKFEIKRKKFGWKDLLVREVALKAPVSAEHINDGYLRVLAMLSQKYSKAGFLLFDEIENGINQELINKLLVQLQNFNGKQVMVTTHSALVLNYLEDEVAKNSVVLLYKDNHGHTQAKKFFEIAETSQKLGLLGPGEVMSDTNLEQLSARLVAECNGEHK